MEIIHLVLGKANPARMNGVNKVVYQLATKQVEAGLNARVWGFTRDTAVNYPARNFATRLFATRRDPFYLNPDFKRALRDLDPERVVFHLHGGWIPLFYRVAHALREAGLRYVITPHGAYNVMAMRRSRWMKSLYFRVFEKFVLRHAATIHCIGASEVTGLGTLYATDKAVLQPYGMEFAATGRPPERSSGEELVFGFVGRLDYHTKGLDLMLEAFANHFRDQPDVTLWLIGDGAGRTAVENKIEALGIDANVILLGARYGEEKDALIRRMHVFLHPSRNEGLPSAVLEAAALGIPSIVTDATNVGEYVREHGAGLVVQNEDVEMLGWAMFYCFNADPAELREMGNNATRMVETSFGWTHVVDRFNRLYA